MALLPESRSPDAAHEETREAAPVERATLARSLAVGVVDAFGRGFAEKLVDVELEEILTAAVADVERHDTGEDGLVSAGPFKLAPSEVAVGRVLEAHAFAPERVMAAACRHPAMIRKVRRPQPSARRFISRIRVAHLRGRGRQRRPGGHRPRRRASSSRAGPSGSDGPAGEPAGRRAEQLDGPSAGAVIA